MSMITLTLATTSKTFRLYVEQPGSESRALSCAGAAPALAQIYFYTYAQFNTIP